MAPGVSPKAELLRERATASVRWGEAQAERATLEVAKAETKAAREEEDKRAARRKAEDEHTKAFHSCFCRTQTESSDFALKFNSAFSPLCEAQPVTVEFVAA